MLDVLRKSVAGPFVKILIGVLILSFAVWGIQDIFGNYKRTVAIEMGDYEITIDDFINEYNKQLSTVSSQLGKQISHREALSYGIDKLTIDNLLKKIILKAEIDKYKIATSETYVAREIVNDDMFKSDGKFNKARYEQLLSYAGYDEESFLQNEVNTNKQFQLFNVISSTNYVPDALLDMIHLYNNSTKKIEYTKLLRSEIDVKTPSESELIEFYNKFNNGYKKSETRDFEALILNAELLAQKIKISPSQVKEYYEINKENFAQDEEREVYQFFFNDISSAQELYNASNKNPDIDILIEEFNFKKDDVYLGFLTQDAIFDKKISDIAFGLERRTFSNPTEGEFGISVIYVDEITESKTPSLEEASDIIQEDLSYIEGQTQSDKLYYEIEELILDNKTINEISELYDLELLKLEKIDINGFDNDGIEVDIINNEDILQKIFESETDDFIEVIETNDNTFVWINLKSINKPYIRSFKEVRSLVTSDMIEKRQNDREIALIEEIKTVINSNSEIPVSLQKYLTESTISNEFSRNNPIKEFSTDFNEKVLSANIGDIIIGKSSSDTLIAKVIEVNKPININQPDIKIIKNLNTQMKNDLFEQYLSNLQGKYNVKVFQENIDRLFMNQS